jgi:hypothetical protein
MSLAPIVASLRRHLHYIIAGSALGAALVAALAVAVPAFEAAGFYYTPGWSLAEFKRFRSEFGSADAVQAYFAGTRTSADSAAHLLIARARESSFWTTSVRPLHPITKKDAKEIFESTKDKDSSTIIGLELQMRGRDARTAQQAVVTFGEYLTQTLLLTTLQGWASSRQAAGNAELLKAENQVLQTRYALEQTRERIDELRALQAKYPEAQRMESRQVVNADASSARYLAPITQIIALESGAAEMNESLRRMERRERQLRIEVDFFDKAAAASKSARDGRVLLDRLSSVLSEVMEAVDQDDDAIREVANRFALDLKSFRDQFAIGFGFRSPVLEPSRSTRKVGQAAALGVMGGSMFGWGTGLMLARRRRSARPDGAVASSALNPAH